VGFTNGLSGEVSTEKACDKRHDDDDDDEEEEEEEENKKDM
jgi:hypothetical protein